MRGASDNGAVHRHVSRSLATLGYLVHYRILNSAEYGAPQSRKRLFYVAVRPGHAFRWPEPVPSDKRRVLEDVLEPTSPKYIARADITAGPPRYPSLSPASPPPRISRWFTSLSQGCLSPYATCVLARVFCGSSASAAL